MAKPKTLRERANDYAHSKAIPGEGRIEAAREGYIAGHRAGARLTKEQRAVIEAAVKWASDGGRTLQGRADTEPHLVAAVKELRSKKVRK